MNSFNQQKIASICGAPGHDQYFCDDARIKKRIFTYADFICRNGITAFLNREYPEPDNKNIILNEIDGRLFCVDGNCHLVSLLIACPSLTIGDLRQYAPKVIRFWNKGIEYNRNIYPYDIYIPYRINTDKIPSVRYGIDYFKSHSEKVKIIPADIPFDSRLFLPLERGCPLFQTAISMLKETAAS